MNVAVVITDPTSTTNMTGFRSWIRGSSFVNESIVARVRMSRVKSFAVWRANSVLLVECEVELEHVHAGLPEEAERAADRVGVDQVLHGREREVANGGDPPRLQVGV